MLEDRPEALGNINVEKVKRFRREIHGLAGFWIFFGCLLVGVAIFLLTAGKDISFRQMGADELTFGAAVALLVGGLWFVSGLASAYKQIWGVYTGLVVTYLNLLNNLIGINICGLVISLVVIIQAHRVLNVSRELRNRGIPLTYKPR
jgi:hypothetical protein